MAFVLSSSNFLVAEGHKLRFSVIRLGDRTLLEEVVVSTSCGTAKCDLDYERLNKKLIFKPDVMQVDVDLDIYADRQPEFTEDFRIQLLQISSIGAGQLGEPSVALVEILDRDTDGGL